MKLYCCRRCEISAWAEHPFDLLISREFFRVLNIDGNNLVCPSCASEPETVKEFISDGWLAAKIDWEFTNG